MKVIEDGKIRFKVIVKNEFERCLGRALVEWRNIELIMFALFRYMHESLTFPESSIIWTTAWETSRQYGMLNELLEMRFAKHTKTLHRWQALSGRIKAAIKTRNNLAHHFAYTWADENLELQTHLVPPLTNPKNLPVNIEASKIDLKEMRLIDGRFRRLKEDLNTFLVETFPRAVSHRLVDFRD